MEILPVFFQSFGLAKEQRAIFYTKVLAILQGINIVKQAEAAKRKNANT